MVRGGGRIVRYSSGDNSALRAALWNVWGEKCYWCTKPVDFDVTQIDHIIPQAVGDARLQELKLAFRLADDFDLDDPQNLAPICIPCNGAGRKGSTADDAPVVSSMLERAAKRRAAVINRVQGFGKSGRIAEHLLNVRMADLSDQAIRRVFAEQAPALVQILSMADSELVDYPSFELVDVAVLEKFDEYQTVDVTLNGRGRMAATLLDEVCGRKLDAALRGPVLQLINEVYGRAQAALESQPSVDPICAGEPVSDFFTINLDSIDYERAGKSIRFIFMGNFAASLTASMVRADSRGDGLEQLQGDIVVNGRFSTDSYWTFSGFKAGDCFIDAWDQDL